MKKDIWRAYVIQLKIIVCKFFICRKGSQPEIGDLMKMEKICNIVFNGKMMKLIKRSLSRYDLFEIIKNQASIDVVYLIAFKRDHGSPLLEKHWRSMKIVILIISPELVVIITVVLHYLTNKEQVEFFLAKNPNEVRINFSNEW